MCERARVVALFGLFLSRFGFVFFPMFRMYLWPLPQTKLSTREDAARGRTTCRYHYKCPTTSARLIN